MKFLLVDDLYHSSHAVFITLKRTVYTELASCQKKIVIGLYVTCQQAFREKSLYTTSF